MSDESERERVEPQTAKYQWTDWKDWWAEGKLTIGASAGADSRHSDADKREVKAPADWKPPTGNWK